MSQDEISSLDVTTHIPMNTHPLPLFARVCGIVGLAVFTSLAGQAAVIADFSGGNGTSEPDQFLGTPGDGWQTAWSRRVGSGSSENNSVIDTNPLSPGGGNYLAIDYTRTVAGSNSRAGVARQFVNSGMGGIDMTKPYEISFEFRADALVGWTTSADQIVFSSEVSSTIGGPGADSPWALLIRADTGWVVSDGNGSGQIANNFNFSELGLTSLQIGAVYKISVFVDPANNGYDLTISTGATTYRASDLNGGELLGFRTNATAANANYLQFRATNNDVGDTIAWSLDNIAVVPEPTSVALILSGAGVCFGRRFFRRMR